MERGAWIDKFVATLRGLGVKGHTYFLGDIGEQLHHTRGHLDPAAVAQSEVDIWPPGAVHGHLASGVVAVRSAVVQTTLDEADAVRAEAEALLEGLQLATLRLKHLVSANDKANRKARCEARAILAAAEWYLTNGSPPRV